MELEKAKKTLTGLLDETSDDMDAGDVNKALNLGIAAIERIEILRHFFEAQATLPLPGETE